MVKFTFVGDVKLVNIMYICLRDIPLFLNCNLFNKIKSIIENRYPWYTASISKNSENLSFFNCFRNKMFVIVITNPRLRYNFECYSENFRA